MQTETTMYSLYIRIVQHFRQGAVIEQIIEKFPSKDKAKARSNQLRKQTKKNKPYAKFFATIAEPQA